MTAKPVHGGVRAALEFGPIIGFVVAYFLFKDASVTIGGTDYTGIVAVMGAFIPIFLVAIAALWALSGQIARIQVATAIMLVLFGGMSVWFNDARFFKMKPTVIYLLLALVLGIGLWRGQSWLQYIMEDMVPLKPKGWMILTRRVTILFLLSAAANEVVWRTQSDTIWVVFETLIMPLIIAGFFLSQIPLYVEHATFNALKKKR